MARPVHHRSLIDWLERTSAWLTHRTNAVGQTRVELDGAIRGLVFEAPAGDRVKTAVRNMSRNLVRVDDELHYLATMCRREADRLRRGDQHIARLYEQGEQSSAVFAAVGAPVVVSGIAEFERDPQGWMAVREPEFACPENTMLEDGDDDEDGDGDVALGWAIVDGRVRCAVPPAAVTGWSPVGQAGWAPVQGGAAPASGRWVMELDSMMRTSTGLDRVASALQDHQTALTRELGHLPPDLRPALRRRLDRARRLSAVRFERGARRMTRMASLLRTRSRTPGLIDGVFNPGLPPIVVAGQHLDTTIALSDTGTDLVALTDALMRTAADVDDAMEALWRALPVIYGAVPDEWWKYSGQTNDLPPRAVWGDESVPAETTAAVGAVTTAAAVGSGGGGGGGGGSRGGGGASSYARGGGGYSVGSGDTDDAEHVDDTTEVVAEPVAAEPAEELSADAETTADAATAADQGVAAAGASAEGDASAGVGAVITASNRPDGEVRRRPTVATNQLMGVGAIVAGGTVMGGVAATRLAKKKARERVTDWSSYVANRPPTATNAGTDRGRRS